MSPHAFSAILNVYSPILSSNEQGMISLTTLGSVRVHRGETAVADLPAQRLRFALLTYLACETEVSREEVVAMFWPDRDTARGKHALRQMLYELRGVLGDDWIEVHRDRVVCRVDVDATDFERAAAEGRSTDALRMYRGAFLAGFAFDHGAFEGWVDRRRAHLARVHRRVRRDHIALLVSAERLDEALTEARRWVDLDPLDDEAAHTLIQRLFHAGQRTAALQYFESYEKQLSAELQVDPIDETIELVASIRRGDQPSATAIVGQRSTTTSPARPATAEPTAVAPDSPADVPARHRLSRLLPRGRVQRTAAAVGFLAIVGIGLYALPRDEQPTTAPRTMRVAVLPLDDHSEDGSLTGMAAELTDQLTASLAQSHLLEVISARSIRLWSENGATMDSIVRLLSADYIVAGSVRRDADTVSLSLEFIDGRDGRLVRTAPISRPWTESRTLVGDVVTTAATILREEVGAQLETQRFRASTNSETAWQRLLEGKDAAIRYVALLRATEYDAALRQLDRADSLFAWAERLDPRWSEPLVQRAGVMQRRASAMQNFVKPGTHVLDSLIRRGLGFADRAMQLDPNSVGAHEVRGILLLDLARAISLPDSAARLTSLAEGSLRTAVRLEPRRQLAHRHLAQLHFNAGRYGEALLSARDAYRSDPYSDVASRLLYIMFSASFEVGEDQQADSWCMAARSRFADQGPFAWCLFALHGWGTIAPEPLKLRRELEQLPPVITRNQPEIADRLEGVLAAAFARAGQPDSARAILRRLETSPQPEYLYLRAAAHVQLGENDTAIHLLRRFLAQPEGSPSVLRQRQFWKLRGHPDFDRLTRQG